LFEEIRHHFRKFLMVQIENGQEVYFRFYDPRVLREFLPTPIDQELQVFFGPVEQFLIEAGEPETLLNLKCNRGSLEISGIDVHES
jgi:hypothetical protein